MIPTSTSKMKAVIAFIIFCMILQSCVKKDELSVPVSATSVQNAETGQIVGNQQVISVPVTKSGSISLQALLWLPDEYSQTPKTYPLIIALHGIGERGTDITKLLSGASIAGRIAKGFIPEAINPIDRKLYKFIVVSPQDPNFSCEGYQVRYMLPALIKKYRIDTTRIYITGYSAGGRGAWSCVTDDTTLTKRIAALAPISAANVENSFWVDGYKILRYQNIPLASTYKIPVWEVCGTDDPYGFWNTALDYIGRINDAKPIVKAKLTGLNNIGHCGWCYAYNPNWRVDNMNMYEWLLQYRRVPSYVKQNLVRYFPVFTKPHPK